MIRHLDAQNFSHVAMRRTENDFIYPPDWEAFDSIIHLAAGAHKKKSQKTNLSYTLNLTEKAINSNVRQFIFVSSIGVLGEFSGNSPFNSDSPYNPYNDYSLSKMEAEEAIKRAFRGTNVKWTIIRPPLVYGAGAKGNFRALSNLVQKVPIMPLGSIKSVRSFCSVNNLCDLIIHCLGNERSYNQTFLVSDDTSLALIDMIKMLYRSLDKSCWLVPIPYPLMHLAGLITGKTQTLRKLNSSLTLDISYTKETLGWCPPYAMEAEIREALKNDQAV